MVRVVDSIVLFVIAHLASGMINNTQIEARKDLQVPETRRSYKEKKHLSTSSSEDRVHSDTSDQESLGLSDSSTSTDDKESDSKPLSSLERTGWRKWHRKCTLCPEDMVKKWRDPTIKWVCGAYQRARRSFKSLCMMHYRNCQDGTMFVKIHDHRCSQGQGYDLSNNSSKIFPHGDHFFYSYKVELTDDSTDSRTSDTLSDSSSI